ARGARTLWQALGLVPGISLALEMTGERQVLSRGVGYGYAAGNIKVLLDGVTMNSAMLATANPVLNLPIEQIERIEVIRGPGSSLHGEFAYAGVINVVTRRASPQVFVRAGEEGEAGAGLIWQWRDAARDLELSLNAAGLERDGEGVWVERDALFATGDEALSLAPGPANSAARQRSLFVDLRWGEWFGSLKLLDDAGGDYFGINHFLPPDDGRLATRQRERVIELGRELRWSEHLWGRLRLEAHEHQHDRQRLYVFPAGYLGDADVFMDRDYREQRTLGALDLHWRPHEAHAVFLGLEASRIVMDTARWSWSGFPYELPPTWIDPRLDRQIFSAVVQDQYRPLEALTLTASLRYDNYSDFGVQLSPRLAAVWRLDAHQVLKFQYAQGFRPPTFYEVGYSTPGDIDVGEIATWELGYILTRPSWEGRLILFQSDLDDPVLFDKNKDPAFSNGPDVRLRGLELEYQHRLGSRLKLDANLSLVESRQRGSGEALPGGADVLGNLGLLWRPLNDWTLALQMRHVGERTRDPDDPRERVPASTQFDLTLSGQPSARGPSLFLGVKNLTDAEVRYPDQFTSYDGVNLPYPDGYPSPGRQWWLSLALDL
ncbi:MAG: TonB-dependent receptor, partial [Chromatiaceae bacterium]|nr:TonB-dependent receptor [Chromatiaceae bacterium]